MFEKGQEYRIKIEDVSDQGQGIGKIDGFTVFVKDTFPGDVVLCELTKVKKRFALSVNKVVYLILWRVTSKGDWATLGFASLL